MSAPSTPPTSTVMVFYDGQCPLCLRSIAWLQTRDHDQRLSYSDIHEPGLVARNLPRVPFDQAMQAMHIKLPDGSVYRGFDAVVAIARVLPGYRWAAWLGRLPVLRPLGQALYRAIARSRTRQPCSNEACGPFTGR